MNEIRILGIQIYDRIKEAGLTQQILSKYAGCIKTRLRFHELNDAVCSRVGFVLLELAGDKDDWSQFEAELHAIEGLKVQKMSFVV